MPVTTKLYISCAGSPQNALECDDGLDLKSLADLASISPSRPALVSSLTLTLGTRLGQPPDRHPAGRNEFPVSPAALRAPGWQPLRTYVYVRA